MLPGNCVRCNVIKTPLQDALLIYVRLSVYSWSAGVRSPDKRVRSITMVCIFIGRLCGLNSLLTSGYQRLAPREQRATCCSVGHEVTYMPDINFITIRLHTNFRLLFNNTDDVWHTLVHL